MLYRTRYATLIEAEDSNLALHSVFYRSVENRYKTYLKLLMFWYFHFPAVSCSRDKLSKYPVMIFCLLCS